MSAPSLRTPPTDTPFRLSAENPYGHHGHFDHRPRSSLRTVLRTLRTPPPTDTTGGVINPRLWPGRLLEPPVCPEMVSE